MTIEDKLKIYKEGFRDGFDEGYKRGRADADLLNPFRDASKFFQQRNIDSCYVCGKTGVNNSVCTYHGCPTRITSLSVKDLKISPVGNTDMPGQ